MFAMRRSLTSARSLTKVMFRYGLRSLAGPLASPDSPAKSARYVQVNCSRAFLSVSHGASRAHKLLIILVISSFWSKRSWIQTPTKNYSTCPAGRITAYPWPFPQHPNGSQTGDSGNTD